MDPCIYLRDYVIYRSVRMSSKIASLDILSVKHSLKTIWYSDDIDSKLKQFISSNGELNNDQIKDLCKVVPENIVKDFLSKSLFNKIYCQRNFTSNYKDSTSFEYERTIIFIPCDKVTHQQIYKNLW